MRRGGPEGAPGPPCNERWRAQAPDWKQVLVRPHCIAI